MTKCAECLFYSNSSSQLPFSFLNGEALSRDHTVKYLGVYFSSNMAWSTLSTPSSLNALNNLFYSQAPFYEPPQVSFVSNPSSLCYSCNLILLPDHFSRTAQQRLYFYHLPVVLLTHNTLTHVNAFLPLLSMTRFTLFNLALQMFCLLPTIDLLLNAFDVELLSIETPSSLAYPIIL